MLRIYSFILFSSISLLGIGQTTVEAIVEKMQVRAHERFSFEIIVNDLDCQVAAPDFGGLEVVAGPSQMQYNSQSYENGVWKEVTEIHWTYELRSKTTGKFTIGTVKMKCQDGTEYETDPITISVVDGDEEPENESYFLRLTTDKSEVYVGEPFVATLKYYSAERPSSFEGVDLGDAVGIYRKDLNPGRTSFTTEIESYNGRRYYTIELREELCYAQRNGEVTLTPYYAALAFQRDFFSSDRKESYSNPITIKVKPIPVNNTTNFSGLVGDFTLKSEISDQSVKMGDAIDLKVSIGGTGNFHEMAEIKPDFPKEFNQFEPEIEDLTTATPNGITGVMEYNYVLIPTKAGTYEIPEYSFSYFDLRSKKMKEISSPAYTISVEQREGVVFEPQRNDDLEEAVGIRYIESEPATPYDENTLFFGSWSFIGLSVGPLALVFALLYVRRKKENLSDEDKLKIQQKKALKEALAQLSEVRALHDSGENKKALSRLQGIILNYFRQKFNVGLSELSQREITQRLHEQHVNDTEVHLFTQVWNTIEMGQYAPISDANLTQLEEEAVKLLTALDKQI